MTEVPPTPEASEPLAEEDPFQRTILIGMVVERFALLESTLRRTAWLLLFADPVAAHVLTTQESGKRLIDLCRLIIKESARKGVGRASQELFDALETAGDVLQRRNDLFHNVQVPGEGFRMEVLKYRRGQDLPIVVSAGTAEMKALWFDTNGVITQLMEHRPTPPFEMPPHYT